MSFSMFMTVVVPYIALFLILFVGIPIVIFGLLRGLYEALAKPESQEKAPVRNNLQRKEQHA